MRGCILTLRCVSNQRPLLGFSKEKRQNGLKIRSLIYFVEAINSSFRTPCFENKNLLVGDDFCEFLCLTLGILISGQINWRGLIGPSNHPIFDPKKVLNRSERFSDGASYQEAQANLSNINWSDIQVTPWKKLLSRYFPRKILVGLIGILKVG